MERYKTEILTVEGFLEERPDMEVHTNKTIQSAIYQVAGMLNAKTGGLIQKVWDYSVVDRTNTGNDSGFTQPDPNCVYYRTPEQLAFIKQAFVEQTQYNINLGNDYTQGGGSYSIGNVNSSYSKPINFDTFAPMVEYLLQQARVLDLQSFLNEKSTTKNNDNCMLPELEYDCKCLTENYADKTYLKIYQPDADVGRVAIINNANIITFEPIQKVFEDSGGLKAKEIWDPVEQVYKQINQFGVEYFGGLNAETIYKAIYASGIVWNPNIPYQKDWIVMFHLNDIDMYGYAKSKVENNLGNNPNNSPNEWEILPIEPANLDVIFDYIDEKFKEFSQVNYISESNGEIIQFDSQQDYETYKATMGVDDSYFESVNDNVAYVNQTNTFTRPQEFNSGIILNNGTVTGVHSPIADKDVVNLAYFNQFAVDPINEANEHINLVDNGLVNLQQNKQDVILKTDYKLRDYYNNIETIFIPCQAGSGFPNSNATGIRFNTIHTNLTAKKRAIYTIKTIGDLGNSAGPMWYSACQIGCYVGGDEKIVVFVNKLYDNNWDGNFYQDHIYIQEWEF